MAKQNKREELLEEVYQKPIKKKKKKKRKRRLSSQFYWMLLVIASITTSIVFFTAPMFPTKWAFLVFFVLLGIVVLTGIFSSIFSPRNRIQKFINCFLAVCLGIVSILTPYYINKITALFESAIGDKVRINLYVLTDEYKAEHSDIFQNTITLPETDSSGNFKNVDMTNYADAVYGTTVATDSENQQYAVKQLKELCGKQVQTLDKASLSEDVQAFYENHSDILVMSEALAATISDIEGFENFETDTKVLYSIDRPIDSSAADTVAVDMTTKPFTIFFGGNDTEGELSLQGRTDVDMTVTVNPNTHQILIANLPRDSWVQNPYYNNQRDKLTHLGLAGIGNTLSGLGNLYGIEIPNYVIINFTTFVSIVNALGGVTVQNPYTFTAVNGTVFYEGEISMPADIALLYCRERENLPDGDFGRNMHQQLVMKGIISKLTSSEVITKFNSLLDGISGQFLTNISSDSIYALAQKQLDEGIEWNIVNYHVAGETGMEVCASATGQYLSVVYPYDNQIEFVKEEIQKVINGETITQQELPEGQITTDYSADHIVLQRSYQDTTSYDTQEQSYDSSDDEEYTPVYDSSDDSDNEYDNSDSNYDDSSNDENYDYEESNEGE